MKHPTEAEALRQIILEMFDEFYYSSSINRFQEKLQALKFSPLQSEQEGKAPAVSDEEIEKLADERYPVGEGYMNDNALRRTGFKEGFKSALKRGGETPVGEGEWTPDQHRMYNMGWYDCEQMLEGHINSQPQTPIPEKGEEKSLGGKLSDLRYKSGKTLRDIESSIGISNAYLSQLENDKIKNPSATVLYKLASFYGVELDSFMKPENPVTQMNTRLKPDEEEKLLEYLRWMRTGANVYAPVPSLPEPPQTQPLKRKGAIEILMNWMGTDYYHNTRQMLGAMEEYASQPQQAGWSVGRFPDEEKKTPNQANDEQNPMGATIHLSGDYGQNVSEAAQIILHKYKDGKLGIEVYPTEELQIFYKMTSPFSFNISPVARNILMRFLNNSENQY